jgi:predicted Fe-Mo cluster-binding NifX family protein
MKIAVSSDGGGMNGRIAAHFGRCPEFVLVETDGKQVKSAQAIENPYFGNPVPGKLPEFVRETGADVVMSGGAGPMAKKLLDEMGIKLILGCEGIVSEVVRDYLEGNLKTGQDACDH